MIDENLPVFYWKATKDQTKQDATIYLAQYGNDPVPAYTLRYPDPSSSDSRNRYAAALYDCYSPDILFAEVLLIPQWTQVNLSPEELRKQGGIPPKPEPALPNECTLQLYNPDQQVAMVHTPSKWNASETWDFEIPQQTFRQPSGSALDRGKNDPAMLEGTPTIPLKWKREGKLTKDLTLFLAGKQRNPDGSKKKHKEPDIPIAFFKNLREITIYEPNLSRVEIEDPKGLEVMVILGATIIRDVYHGTMQSAFNITDAPPHRRSSADAKKPAYAPPPAAALAKPAYQQQQHVPPPSRMPASSSTAAVATHPPLASRPGAPPTDPRTQWELEAETARLRQQSEVESKAQEKERRKQEKKNERAARQLAEEEERAARARQAAVDAETERLRRAYAVDSARLLSPPLPPLPPRRDDGKTAKEREKEAKRREKERRKNPHAAQQFAKPSVPSASFLQPQSQHWGQPGPRPASATGFVSGQGHGPTGPGGPGWVNGGGYGPYPPGTNPWNRQAVQQHQQQQQQQPSSGFLSGLFGHHGGSSGGRDRELSDTGPRTVVNKRSSLF